MNLAAVFIKRPITTTLIMLGIVVFGVMSYRVLPVSDLPAIDFPTISVQASLTGASPETVASAVALPLEKQFSTISGLSSMNSTSTQGNTNITLQFDLSRDIDAAAQDVQSMIARAARQLPSQITPPSYQKVNPGDSSDPVPEPAIGHPPALDGERVRRIDDLAADLHGDRRRAGPGVRRRQVRRAHRRGPAKTVGSRDRHG